jgi:hypothetical protein
MQIENSRFVTITLEGMEIDIFNSLMLKVVKMSNTVGFKKNISPEELEMINLITENTNIENGRILENR